MAKCEGGIGARARERGERVGGYRIRELTRKKKKNIMAAEEKISIITLYNVSSFVITGISLQKGSGDGLG